MIKTVSYVMFAPFNTSKSMEAVSNAAKQQGVQATIVSRKWFVFRYLSIQVTGYERHRESFDRWFQDYVDQCINTGIAIGWAV